MSDILLTTTALPAEDPFWERFLTSPGFGGAMAVVAASIAAWLAYKQFRLTKAKNADDRWWETLTWVYDRTVVENSSRPPLPQRVTFSMLTALSTEVDREDEDRLRGEAITSILTMFEGEEEGAAGAGEVGDGSVPVPVVDAEAAAILDVLRDDLKGRGYGQAARLLSTAITYEDNVSKALERITESVPGVSAMRARHGRARGNTREDFTVQLPGNARIFIEVKYASKPVIPSLVADWIHQVKQNSRFPKDGEHGGAVIVTNQPITSNAHGMLTKIGDGKILHALWRGADDDSALVDALQRFGFPE